MAFSEEQVRALKRTVPARNIRTRNADGKELSYIEGWYAIAEANRIFGFASWDRETVETRCVLGREARGTFTAVYLAKVRITVHTPDAVVVRDGHGTGEAHGNSAGEVHDRALKAAETDGTKRALTTFGRAFGLALYAGGKSKPRPVNGRADHDPVANDSRHSPAQPAQVMAAIGYDPEPSFGENAAPLPAPTNGLPRVQTALSVPKRPPLPLPRPVNGRINKRLLTFAEVERVRDKEHLRYVSSQPCLLCSAKPADAHHLRFAQPKALGRKVSDEFTVPLCRRHHHDLHRSGNEAAWWHDIGMDPLEIAADLWRESQSLHDGKGGTLANGSGAVESKLSSDA